MNSLLNLLFKNNNIIISAMMQFSCGDFRLDQSSTSPFQENEIFGKCKKEGNNSQETGKTCGLTEKKVTKDSRFYSLTIISAT